MRTTTRTPGAEQDADRQDGVGAEFPPELQDVVDEGVEPDDLGELHLAPPDDEFTEPELRAMHLIAETSS